jgi:hypothetical protein
VEAYVYRGIAFVSMGLRDKACADLRRACELGYCDAWEYAKKGGVCF